MNEITEQEMFPRKAEREYASTRILLTNRTGACANCGVEIELNQPHKHVSYVSWTENDDTVFEEAVLCNSNCLSGFGHRG